MAAKKKKSTVVSVKAKPKAVTPQRLFLIGAVLLGAALGLMAGRAWFGQSAAEHDVLPPLVPHVSDEQAIETMTFLRKALPTMKNPDGSLMIEETEAEKSQPIIPVAAAEDAIHNGRISALARYCQMNWEAHSAAFLKRYRNEGYSEKQVHFLGMVHGYGMAAFFDKLDYDCSAANKAIIQKYLVQ